MLDQANFDRSEEIADALDEQAGLERPLIAILKDKLPPEDEKTVFALIHAQRHCRNRAMFCAREIAISGGGA